MNASTEINELAAALAKAQLELENAHKNSANPHFKSKYADLAEVLNTVRPVLAKHGLAVAQFPSLEGNVASVETMLMHSSGQWISNVSSAPLSKADVQGVGSVTTYLRRYSLAAIAGVAQEDDDANAATQPGKPMARQVRKPTLSDGEVADHDAAIEAASDLDSLKKAVGAAKAAAAGNDELVRHFHGLGMAKHNAMAKNTALVTAA